MTLVQTPYRRLRSSAAASYVLPTLTLLFLFSGFYKTTVPSPVDWTVLMGSFVALALSLRVVRLQGIVQPLVGLIVLLNVVLALRLIPDFAPWGIRKIAEGLQFRLGRANGWICNFRGALGKARSQKASRLRRNCRFGCCRAAESKRSNFFFGDRRRELSADGTSVGVFDGRKRVAEESFRTGRFNYGSVGLRQRHGSHLRQRGSCRYVVSAT